MASDEKGSHAPRSNRALRVALPRVPLSAVPTEVAAPIAKHDLKLGSFVSCNDLPSQGPPEAVLRTLLGTVHVLGAMQHLALDHKRMKPRPCHGSSSWTPSPSRGTCAHRNIWACLHPVHARARFCIRLTCRSLSAPILKPRPLRQRANLS